MNAAGRFSALVLAGMALTAGVAGKVSAASRQERDALGLKEALSVSIDNAVERVGRADGYFKNPSIKIPLPKPLRPVEKGMRFLGQGAKVDDFVKSMNRAAEKAAPQAVPFFMDAIKQITFDDVREILTGGDHAATDYFKAKTSAKLMTAFTPVVRKQMDAVGVTRQYREMVGKLDGLPLAGLGVDSEESSLDLDRYVVKQALNGLFHELGKEEGRIRRDPVARVTDLLKDVFGR